MKKSHKYKILDSELFKHQLVCYCSRFHNFCFLDSNLNKSNNDFDYLIAFNVKNKFTYHKNLFQDLKSFINEQKNQNWIFGFLTYDVKNYIESLNSQNIDLQDFPIIHFFTAQVIIKVQDKTVNILFDCLWSPSQINDLFQEIVDFSIPKISVDKLKIQSRINKKKYLDNIKLIKNKLQSGDIYEINYCQEFYVENIQLDPYVLFNELNSISKAPFTSFYKLNNHFCLCASPERFFKKTGNKIISQPIKGTIKRIDNVKLDQENKNYLLNNKKELSENVMIVDLVRNDLSKIAKKNSVNVEELAALYTYKDVHHLISTISCQVDENKHIVDVIQALFPMGSMTGAPKLKSMELIEEYEDTLRGLYSGTIGYIQPNGDCDFNVVIRSVLYNKERQYLSFMVGGAITIDSDPELEYEECLAKAKSIFKVLTQ